MKKAHDYFDSREYKALMKCAAKECPDDRAKMDALVKKLKAVVKAKNVKVANAVVMRQLIADQVHAYKRGRVKCMVEKCTKQYIAANEKVMDVACKLWPKETL